MGRVSALFASPSTFLRRLPPSDRAVIGFLGLAFLVTCLVGLIALERLVLVEVPVSGGHITEGITGNPRFANPLLALTEADRDVATLTYAGLMGEGADGLRPVVAESYTVSPDGKVYTFTIRKNARFSDGTPITADDVVFTVQKAQDPGLKSPEYANWANIRAEAVDAHTVKFTLPKAYAPFIDDTTLGILPTHVWKNVSSDLFPFDAHVERPIGSGPFKVTRVVRNGEGAITEYDLAANANYPLGKPYLDGMTLKFYATSDALLAAYKNHQVESAYGIPVKGARTAPYSRVFAVFFNDDNNKALGQLAVRKALSLAIDRTALVRDVLGGYATPLLGPVPPGSGVTSPAIPEGDATELARKTLTDAGWSFSTTTSKWSNAKLKLTLDPIDITTSNLPELKTLASAIQADWQKLGVETTLVYDDPSTLVASAIRPRNFEALYFGMVVGTGSDLYPFWDSSQKSDPGLNIAGYGDTSVDTLLAKARTETDPVKRTAEVQQASDAIASDYPVAFTHAPNFVYALPWKVKGVVLPQIAIPADRFANVSSWYERTEFVWPIFVPKVSS